MCIRDRCYGTGRRKKSIARVYLVPGTGKITINKRDIDNYFGLETLKVVVRQPLVATAPADKFDVIVTVRGGGFTGQAGALSLIHIWQRSGPLHRGEAGEPERGRPGHRERGRRGHDGDASFPQGGER